MRLVVLMALLPILSSASLPPPEGSYKILFLLPYTTRSHRILHRTLATNLADRGHQITMLTNQAPSSKHPNIHEFTHGIREADYDSFNVFEYLKENEESFAPSAFIIETLGRKLYHIQEVKDIYNKRKEFDLIVIDSYMNDVVYPFVHEMPFIVLCGMGLEPMHSAVMGNVLNPAYTPSMQYLWNHPLSLIQRAVNIYGSINFGFIYKHRETVPVAQAEIDKHFPGLSPLLELEKNVSLSLINSHYSLDMTQPLLPSQIEVGAMHCRPGKPLPKDVAQWIEEAEHGVIYFSLGSVHRGEFLPVNYRNIVIEAFTQMKERVIWKFEKELEGLPDNVLIRKWLPQQDILAHPKVKVFITHGGLLSSQETIYHSKPVLVIPIYFDQPKVAAKLQRAGFGITLNLKELTVPLVVDSLNEIINNPKYAEAVGQASLLLRDQKETPIDRAVWWTEYVIRHRGAPALRSPGADLSWIEYLCLDVLVLVHVGTFTLFWVSKKLLALACRVNKKKKTE
ncbi:UDP-glycosyltransferase UGT5-like [Oratosquilla oratoria]|uniref:UDP-glycosyltransferase UGT5-like n=1 Tax=Oratosquilla oratoria TaxID=337810 RepID=UPI003F7615F0